MKFHRNGYGIVSLVPLDSEKLNKLQRLAAGLVESLVGFSDSRVCERVLDEFPDLRSHPEAVLELIYLEHVLRGERGDGATLEELQSRFPQYASDIERLMCVDEAMRHRIDAHGQTTVDTRRDPKTIVAVQGQQAARDGSVGSDSADSDIDSHRIGRYEILDVIGRGGMGIVYRARQQGLDRLVALKTLNAFADLDETASLRFESEARLVAMLQHNNIVRIYEIGKDGGTPYFSMEYVSGGDLAQATRSRSLDARQAARLLEVLARAVHEAHRHGVIHRDLKPANILLSPLHGQGSSETRGDATRAQNTFRFSAHDGFDETHFEPKIADFGLATSVTVEVQKTEGGFQGTPSYMAPELMDSRKAVVGPSCDVYSLGAILYDVLAGRPPYQAPTIVETIHQVTSGEPVPLRSLVPGLPRDLETICMKCLNKEASQRYPTALELAEDLQRFLSNRPVLARRASIVSRSWKWSRRNPSLAALIVAMLIGSLSISWFGWQARQSAIGERRARENGELLAYGRQISLANFELAMQNVKRSREHLAATLPSHRQWEWDYLDRLTREPYWESEKADLPVMSVALSPDGKYVAAGYGLWGQNRSEPIRIWDIETNRLVREFRDHPGSVCDLVFSDDGRWLLSTGAIWAGAPLQDDRQQGGAVLWDVESGQPIVKITDIDGKVCRFSRDGRRFFIGSFRGSVFEYECSNGALCRSFKVGRSMVLDLAIDDDGGRLLATNRDGSIVLFDLKSGKETHRMSEQGDPRSIAWRPRSESFTIGKWGGEIQEYVIEDKWFRPKKPTRRSQVPQLHYSPDGLSILVAVTGESIELRDTTTDRIVRRISGLSQHLRSLSMDRFGRRVAIGHSDGRLGVWDLTYQNQSRIQYSLPQTPVGAISAHPSKKLVAIATGKNERNPKQDGGKPRIDIVDLTNGKIVKTIQGHTMPLTSVEYDRDGNLLVSGSHDQTVRVWDAVAGTAVGSLMKHSAPILAAKFVPGTLNVLSCDSMGELRLWNRETGEVLDVWGRSDSALKGGAIEAFDVTTDGEHLVVITSEGELSVWGLVERKKIATRAAAEDIASIEIDPNDAQLAVGLSHGAIEIWSFEDLLTDRHNSKPKRLQGHDAGVHSMAWSPNGKRLVSASFDQSMKLFDVTGGVELLTLDTSREEPMYVAFHANGQQIIRVSNLQLALWNSKAELDVANDSVEERMIGWHSDRLSRALRANDQGARVENATALINLQPDQWNWYSQRANGYLQMRQFALARADFDRALAYEENPSLRSQYARVLLAEGDQDGYRRECRRLWDMVRDSKDPREVNGAVWTLSLGKDCGVPFGEFLPVMERLERENAHARFKNTLALAYFRAGKLQEASRLASLSLKLDRDYSAPFDWIILAMCQREGLVAEGTNSTESSRFWLDRVDEWMAQQKRLTEASQSASTYFRSKMYFEIPHLLDEARSESAQRAGSPEF